ncbi:Galactoside O-acetyltransferase [Fusobacterium necrogenes]|uniref:Galactoside O-acetyltransferase n=1 Tax=Fusobacterium necrogenes TaxID=858 RepID=A0A377GWL0_9FUSO|nr:acyltransferase [Fusobacterium necrogenes]STO31152.1 Galactoside O-acetyltransferase [Fusobacterium necrogenes]
MKILKKILRRIYFEIIWRKNIINKIWFDGIIKIGKKTKFYQPLKLKNGGGGGTVIIGENCSFGFRYGGRFKNGEIEIQTRSKEAKIEIGNNVATNNNIFLCSRKFIKIGDKTLIGRDVVIMDHNGHGIKVDERSLPGTARGIEIKENVWLGNNVVILPGTLIGKNSIVGANSVVKGIFPENVIIQGNPAKIVKKIEVNE